MTEENMQSDSMAAHTYKHVLFVPNVDLAHIYALRAPGSLAGLTCNAPHGATASSLQRTSTAPPTGGRPRRPRSPAWQRRLRRERAVVP
eukprot:7829995-Pyramimonas_sp.AAC.1